MKAGLPLLRPLELATAETSFITRHPPNIIVFANREKCLRISSPSSSIRVALKTRTKADESLQRFPAAAEGLDSNKPAQLRFRNLADVLNKRKNTQQPF